MELNYSFIRRRCCGVKIYNKIDDEILVHMHMDATGRGLFIYSHNKESSS